MALYDLGMQVAFGLRAHSGWAALVAVAGSIRAPQVLERRRIVIADAEMPGSKQPYHAAEGLAFSEAKTLLEQAIASSRALATEALSAALHSLQSRGHEVVGCGILLGSGRTLPPLEKILASHALIHSAEGEMFRDVLAAAAQACQLTVTGIRLKEIDAASLQHIGSFGKVLGPPWTEDQKLATLAALAALSSTSPTTR